MNFSHKTKHLRVLYIRRKKNQTDALLSMLCIMLISKSIVLYTYLQEKSKTNIKIFLIISLPFESLMHHFFRIRLYDEGMRGTPFYLKKVHIRISF